MTRFDDNDDDVVVIVGSGAGGGTLANELCQRGVKTVVLEAGPHHGPTTTSTTSGRVQPDGWLDDPRLGVVARGDGLPRPARVDVKAVGGTTTHWAGAARASRPTSGAAPARAIDGATCSTGRSASPTSSRTTTTPRSRWASRARRPPARREQQLQGDGQRRQARRLRGLCTGRIAQHRPARRPPGHDPGRLQLPGRPRRRSGRRWSRSCPRPRPPASSTCGPTATRPDPHDGNGKVNGVHYYDATATSTVQRRASCAWPATRSRRRACC